jgi:transcriptional regulator GlxA family with amidase domain
MKTLTLRVQEAQVFISVYSTSVGHTLAMELPQHADTELQSAAKSRLTASSLHRVLTYIHEHLPGDLSLATVAAIAHLSPYHFTRLFKQAMGETLHQYVIRQRVEAAQHLLQHESLTLAEVATQVGFVDQSHLGRHFKRLLGVTPKTLVERAGENEMDVGTTALVVAGQKGDQPQLPQPPEEPVPPR